MYTLIEIFDAKQYENIITPLSLKGISKLIYVGTKEVMTKELIENLKSFFTQKKFKVPVEILFVERDNSSSIINRFTQIVQQNQNCIFDVTGGEDVVLSCVGIVAERFDVPIVRLNVENCTPCVIYGNNLELSVTCPSFTVDDFITLQGGRILRHDTVSHLTYEEAEDIRELFKVNAEDCEAYSSFCNIICEFISEDRKHIKLNKTDYQRKRERSRFNIDRILKMLIEKALLIKQSEDDRVVCYVAKSSVVIRCLLKSGNVLEYYTALAAASLPDCFSDIRVGVNVEWDISKNFYETQNEIDVTAVCGGFPVFISCKNGEVRKDALYELDTVSRTLGGPYAKKILVCTYISKSRSAREHFVKRANDMGIKLVFNSHKKAPDEFLRYLKYAIG